MPQLEAAIGFRIHTGWAAGVVVAGSAVALRVVDRRRFTLVETTNHESVFVYHAAAEMDAVAAKRHIAMAREIALASAEREVARLLSELAAADFLRVRGRAAPWSWSPASFFRRHSPLTPLDSYGRSGAVPRCARRCIWTAWGGRRRCSVQGPADSRSESQWASPPGVKASPQRTRTFARPALDAGPKGCSPGRTRRCRGAAKTLTRRPSSVSGPFWDVAATGFNHRRRCPSRGR